MNLRTGRRVRFAATAAVILLLFAATMVCCRMACSSETAPKDEYPYSAVCEVSNTFAGWGTGGSGALVGVDGSKAIVLSCGHLFEEGRGRVICSFPSGWRGYANVLGVDRRHDLSALEIKRPPDVKPLLIREAKA